MLFNSLGFIFVFLPLCLLGFLRSWREGHSYRPAIWWTLGVSLIFYGWDDPWRLLPLILASATFNFLVGRGLARQPSRWLLTFGVAIDHLEQGYFKYSMFLLENIGWQAGPRLPLSWTITLPIGISFYTFTQIAFLVGYLPRRRRANM